MSTVVETLYSAPKMSIFSSSNLGWAADANQTINWSRPFISFNGVTDKSTRLYLLCITETMSGQNKAGAGNKISDE